MDFGEVILRLLLALIIGSIIGTERQLHHKSAGLRTHILVCLGSTLAMLTSIFIYYTFKEETPIDPARMAGQVISGIGFLGAGTIIVTRGSVRGLTTAATLWVTATIGLAIGCGFYLAALITTFIIVLSLIGLEILEEKLAWKEKQEDIDDRTEKMLSSE